MKSRLILLFAGCAYRVAASSRVEVDIANNREKPAAACAARNHFAKRQAAGAMLLLLAQLACNLDAAWLGTTLAEIPHGSAPVQPRTDSNGNRTNVVRRSYEYDLENRLIRVDDGQVRMVYDGDGHRVRKTVPTAGGGSTTTYFRVAQSTVTALTVGSLAVSEDARLAFLATGNPSAAIAGLAGDVGLLVYRGGRLVQQTASSIARAGVMSKIEQPLGHVARRVKNIADDAIVGYRGSVASGVKHSTQGSFDPNDFDLDGFIVSDKLAARAPLRRFRDGGAIPDIGEEAKRIEELLKESFPGYRVNIETIHLPDLDSAGV